jgi:hypothetical protein
MKSCRLWIAVGRVAYGGVVEALLPTSIQEYHRLITHADAE